MTEKIGYKYSIKFNQSLTSGTFAFEGYLAFDHPSEFDSTILVNLLKEQESAFQAEGYKVASIIPNNLKQLANAKPKKEGTGGTHE